MYPKEDGDNYVLTRLEQNGFIHHKECNTCFRYNNYIFVLL